MTLFATFVAPTTTVHRTVGTGRFGPAAMHGGWMRLYLEALSYPAGGLLLVTWFFIVGAPVVLAFDRPSRLIDGYNGLIVWFFAMSVGLSVEVVVTFALLLAGVFGASTFLATHGIILLAAMFLLIRSRRRLPRWSFHDLPAVLFLLLVLAAVCLKAVHPVGTFDDTMYHLPLARGFLDHGDLRLQPFIRFPLSPQNGELLFAAALLLRGEPMTQLAAALPMFIVAVGLLGLSRHLTRTDTAGYLAVGICLTVSFVHHTIGFAMIDCLLALFCWAAVVLITLWEAAPRQQASLLVLAGLFAGMASGTKLFGAIFAAMLVVYVGMRGRRFRDVAILVGPIAFFGCWWYVRSFVIAGDPVHPAGGNIFGFFLWNRADLASQIAEQGTFGTPKRLPYLVSALPRAGATALLLAFPGMIFLHRRDQSVKAISILFVAYFLLWFFVTQVDRYLAPILIAGAFLAAVCLAGIYHWVVRHLFAETGRRVAGAALVGALLIVAVIEDASAARAAHRALANWNGIERGYPGEELVRRADSLRAVYGPRLVQIGFENAIYFYHGEVVGDQVGLGRYTMMRDCYPPPPVPTAHCWLKSAARLRQILRNFNSRLLVVDLTRHEFDAQDYARYFTLLHRSSDGVLLLAKP